jgi:hypothetical protein
MESSSSLSEQINANALSSGCGLIANPQPDGAPTSVPTPGSDPQQPRRRSPCGDDGTRAPKPISNHAQSADWANDGTHTTEIDRLANDAAPPCNENDTKPTPSAIDAGLSAPLATQTAPNSREDMGAVSSVLEMCLRHVAADTNQHANPSNGDGRDDHDQGGFSPRQHPCNSGSVLVASVNGVLPSPAAPAPAPPAAVEPSDDAIIVTRVMAELITATVEASATAHGVHSSLQSRLPRSPLKDASRALDTGGNGSVLHRMRQRLPSELLLQYSEPYSVTPEDQAACDARLVEYNKVYTRIRNSPGVSFLPFVWMFGVFLCFCELHEASSIHFFLFLLNIIHPFWIISTFCIFHINFAACLMRVC